jgi:hypothetical protein
MAASRSTRRRLFGVLVALAIGVTLLAVLFFAGRVWWDALRGTGAAPPVEQARAAGSASVNLAWDKSPDARIAGYRIKYGTERGLYLERVTVGDQASATLDGLRADTVYYIVVVAFDAQGNESPPSNEIEVRTGR